MEDVSANEAAVAPTRGWFVPIVGEGFAFALAASEHRFGRGNVAGALEAKGVSKMHFAVRPAGGADAPHGFCIEDLKSTNGTYINGRRLTGGPEVLIHGARITLGRPDAPVGFTFHVGAAPPSGMAARPPPALSSSGTGAVPAPSDRVAAARARVAAWTADFRAAHGREPEHGELKLQPCYRELRRLQRAERRGSMEPGGAIDGLSDDAALSPPAPRAQAGAGHAAAAASPRFGVAGPASGGGAPGPAGTAAAAAAAVSHAPSSAQAELATERDGLEALGLMEPEEITDGLGVADGALEPVPMPRQARWRFNKDPKGAVRWLTGEGGGAESGVSGAPSCRIGPGELARWFLTEEGLSMRSIGTVCESSNAGQAVVRARTLDWRTFD